MAHFKSSNPALIGLLEKITEILNKGVRDLSGKSTFDDMFPVISAYLGEMGQALVSYTGSDQDAVREIGRIMTASSTSLVVATSLQWQAIGRLAAIVEGLQTNPRTNAASRLATS